MTLKNAKRFRIVVAMMLASASSSLAATVSQFDLECVGTENLYGKDVPTIKDQSIKVHYSVDLARKLYCEECDAARNIDGISKDIITFENKKTASRSFVVTSVNRLNGDWTIASTIGNASVMVSGTCQRRPYTRVPGPKF